MSLAAPERPPSSALRTEVISPRTHAFLWPAIAVGLPASVGAIAFALAGVFLLSPVRTSSTYPSRGARPAAPTVQTAQAVTTREARGFPD